MAQARNFKKLLADQKKNKQKEVISISEAAQDYLLDLQKQGDGTQPFGQKFIKDESISNATVSVIQNFQGDLDMIADADEPYKNLKELIGKYNVFLKELPKSVDKGRFSDKESNYMVSLIKPVIEELNGITGPLLRTRLAFRNFVKQFKPIKVADRLFGNVPIIGGIIKRKIERQEAGEQALRGAERQAGKEKARDARRGIEEMLEQPADELATEDTDDVVKPSNTNKQIKKSKKSASAQEELVKEKAEANEETKGLFEMIAESTYETNENVKKLVDETEEANDSRGGLFGNLGSKIGGLGTLLLGAGGFGLISSGLNMLGKTLLAPFKAVSALVSKIPGLGKTPKAPIKTSPKGVPVAEKKPAKVKQNTSKLVKENVKKGAKVAGKAVKGVARVAGRVFLPLAAAMSIFDAATGVAQAGELLDKEDEDLTFRDKASAGVAGFLSGLTFGLVDKSKTAKFLAGKKDTVETNLTANEKMAFGGYSKEMSQGDSLNTNAVVSDSSPQINNNNVVAPVTNTNMVKNDTYLPPMNAKNNEQTIVDINNGVVY